MKMPDIPPGSILRGPKMEKGLSIWGQICAELEWMLSNYGATMREMERL